MIAYVGIDAHTTNYTLATRMEGSKEPINVNTYSPAVSNIVKYCKAIRKEYGKDTEIVLGYEAGSLGFKLRRDLEQNDLKCIILGPTSIPGTEQNRKRKKKTDKRDAEANRINNPNMADTLLKMGKADFIGMGRGSLADPYLPNKAKEGKLENIRYCIGCLQGCEAGLLNDDCATCLVNPRVGREYEKAIEKTDSPKKVMVIGGGPAGLMAAETAALRGHDVTVYEAQESLGGAFRSAAYPLGKGELSTFVSSLRKSLADLSVPVKLNTEVTEEMIQNEKPDTVIVATGSRPLRLNIEGIDGANVITAEEALLGKKDIGFGPVVVCGGGEVGAETAHYLTQTNHDITVVEMRDDILNDMMPLSKQCLLGYMQETGVKVVTNAKVSKITETSVEYTDKEGNTVSLPAETVVSAFGYKAYNPLEEAAKKYCADVRTVGSAVKAGNALTAVREAYDAAMSI